MNVLADKTLNLLSITLNPYTGYLNNGFVIFIQTVRTITMAIFKTKNV